jgi:glycosyltransferase involved in cell wall biosynthesis
MPFFSIVIPTYNREKQINDILFSLTGQSFNDFEVIIVDDGSVDNTRDIVLKYSNQLDIQYTRTENWGGPARPRNIGIGLSKSDWICFLDSDDSWFETKLEDINSYINSNQDIEFIFHYFSSNSGKTIGKYSPDNSILGNFHKLLYSGNKIILSSIVIKKNLLLKVGLFSENKEFIAIEDYDLLLKLGLNNTKFYCLPKILGYYSFSYDSISQNQHSQIIKERLLFDYYLTKASHFISLNKLQSIIDYRMAHYYSSIGNKRLAFSTYCKVIFKFNNLDLILRSIIKIITFRC